MIPVKSAKLGTAQDSTQFRSELQKKMQNGSQQMKNIQNDLNDLKNMDVSYDKRVSSLTEECIILECA